MTAIAEESVIHRAGIGTGRGTVDADPITTEVIRHGLDAAADQMYSVIVRTAFSPAIYEIADFAASLYDSKVRLLAQAKALPIFLGTMSFAIEAAVARSGGVDALEPGDIIFSTDGYDIGSHPQDATIVLPHFHKGELVAYAAVKAHHMDIGAKDIYCSDTVDVFQEGVIFPSVKLYKAGERQEDLYRTLLANSRMPEALAGDLHAQIASAEAGLAALDRVIAKHGREEFERSSERMFDHGEERVRAVFEQIPDGRYSAEGGMDNNGITEDYVPFEVSVEVSGSDVTIDFTNSAPEQRGPINCPVPTVVSASRIGIMSFAGGDEAANEGHFRPIAVRTKPGTMFHPASPAPLYMYGWSTMQAVELIHRALGEAMPGSVRAGSGGDVCAFIPWGTHPDGTFWGSATDHMVGQGATQDGDGGGPLVHISCSGIKNTPIEVWENRFPFVVDKFQCAPDSGGAGKFRGGPGVDIHYRALSDCELCLPVERTTVPPWGLHGGREARTNSYVIRHPDGSTERYKKVTGVRLPAGSTLEIGTGGGGGFGLPEERDPAAVMDDIREGYISDAAARRDYPHAFEAA